MKQIPTDDVEAIARHMRVTARFGECRGALTPNELSYIELCGRKIGNTIVLFTIDNYDDCRDWFSAPALQRCFHLSISGAMPVERDAWLRSFFSNDIHGVWIESALIEALAPRNGLRHYRQFCGAGYAPIALTHSHELDLRSLGWHRADLDANQRHAA
jgi:hypothetical protein